MNGLLFPICVLVGLALATGAYVYLRKRVGSRSVAAAQCAHLGLASDPLSRGQHASDEHRCYFGLGRERVDLAHQRRFCLTAAHDRCPFLLVNARSAGTLDGASAWDRFVGQQQDWVTRTRDWWRNVSPARPPLTAAQLGHPAGLGAAGRGLTLAARGLAQSGVQAGLRRVGGFGLVTLQAWQTARPQPVMAVVNTPIEEASPVSPIEASTAEAPRVSVASRFVSLLQAAPIHAASGGDDGTLVERGIAAVEDGREMEAYALFKRATEVDSKHARAWFWRAKTAETLDEVIDCLTRANHLEPDNSLIASNLEWATERREANRQAAKAKKTPAAPTEPAPLALEQRPGPLARAGYLVLDLVRAAAAFTAFGLGAEWLLSAMPVQIRQTALGASGLPELRLPDASRLASLVHVPLTGGYDAGFALPFFIGFLAVFVGFGVVNRDSWRQMWAPIAAVAGACLFAG